MPKKSVKKVKKRRRVPKPTRKSVSATQTREPAAAAEDAASRRFVDDLLVRGEAAERDQQGKLPLPATHAIKRRKPDGTVEVERVRFKAF